MDMTPMVDTLKYEAGSSLWSALHKSDYSGDTIGRINDEVWMAVELRLPLGTLNSEISRELRR